MSPISVSLRSVVCPCEQTKRSIACQLNKQNVIIFLDILFLIEKVNNRNHSVYIVYIKLNPTAPANGLGNMNENNLPFLWAFALI